MNTLQPNTSESQVYTIAKCLNELIINSNPDDALEKIVEWLSNSLHLDRCFIFKNHKDSNSGELFTSIIHWWQDGVFDKSSKEIQYVQNLQTSLFPEIKRLLQDKKSFQVTTDTNASPLLQQILLAAGLKAVLLTPIFQEEELWGFIGFGDRYEPRKWRLTETEMLQSLAAAIGVNIETRSLKQKIEERNFVFETALGALNEYLWEWDLEKNTSTIITSSASKGKIKASTYPLTYDSWLENLVHPGDRDKMAAHFKDIMQNSAIKVAEITFRTKSSPQAEEYYWVNTRERIIRDKAGKAIKLVGLSADITNNKMAEYELKTHKEQYDFLVNNLSQVVFMISADGKWTFLSSAWKDILGFDIEATLGSDFTTYLVPQDKDACVTNFLQMLVRPGDRCEQQVRFVHANGDIIWTRILARAVSDDNGNVTGSFGTIENINEQHAADLLLQDSNDKLQTILNSSKEIILTIDLENNVIENVNDAISILGYSPAEWAGQSYKNWSHDQQQKFVDLMKLVVQNNFQVNNQQISFPNKDNTAQIAFEFSSSTFVFKNKKYLLCVLRDVRERLQYEENLNRISEQLTHLISNIDDVYAIYDIETQQFEFVSDNVAFLYGCTKADFIANGLVWKERIHIEDAPGVAKEIEQAIANKTKAEIFYRILTPDGDTKMILEKIAIAKDAGDTGYKLYLVKTDYTHIENIEQSLFESERKFRFISENVSDFIAIHDADGRYTYASPAVKSILGFSPDDMPGKSLFEFVHPEDVAFVMENSLSPVVLYKKETQVRYRLRNSQQEYRWVETYSKPILDAGGNTSSIICSTRDITERVSAENKIRTSEERYRLLSENSNDVVAIYNLQGEFIYVSPSCETVLGYTSDELMGKSIVSMLVKNDEDKMYVTNKILGLSVDKIPRKFTHKIQTKAGIEKVLEVWIKPIFKQGEIDAIQSASRDVTERESLLKELKLSLEKERELNELRTMFVSTASHQFRTPLTVIQSGVELMEMYVENLTDDKQKPFKKQFTKIQAEVERLQSLMNDVLLLGRANADRTPFNPETGDLVAFCTNIAEEKYNATVTADRKILINVTGQPAPADFDPKLLGHAIENIISNGYKYSDDGNILMDISFHPNKVNIAITDFGIGIPEEDQKNLFQPFYRATNTDDFEGTGLGLSVVKEFIEQHKGNIFVKSQLNKGTTITIQIPLTQNSHHGKSS
jgi:PAS domain S-box-containing protein